MSDTTLDFANGIYGFAAVPRQALCVIPREVAESIYYLSTIYIQLLPTSEPMPPDSATPLRFAQNDVKGYCRVINEMTVSFFQPSRVEQCLCIIKRHFMRDTTLDFVNGIYSFAAVPRQALCVIPREVAESIYQRRRILRLRFASRRMTCRATVVSSRK
jgi:hypothetical protein